MATTDWTLERVLVTGGTRGIGAALVQGLVARGASVVATGRSVASVEAARSRLAADPATVQWQVADLTRVDERRRLVAQAQRERLTMLVHNAAVQQLRDYHRDAAGEAITERDEIETNLVAPLELTRALLPTLQLQSPATVVFITSGLALAPKASSPVYCATKAALRSYAKGLRAQLASGERPVRVVEALPPIVDTDMTRGRGQRKLPAAEAARQILDGIAAGRDEVDVGATRLLRMLMRLTPALGERLMIAR